MFDVRLFEPLNIEHPTLNIESSIAEEPGKQNDLRRGNRRSSIGLSPDSWGRVVVGR
jgi:hypothetical protein